MSYMEKYELPVPGTEECIAHAAAVAKYWASQPGELEDMSTNGLLLAWVCTKEAAELFRHMEHNLRTLVEMELGGTIRTEPYGPPNLLN